MRCDSRKILCLAAALVSMLSTSPALAQECVRASGDTVATWCARAPSFSEARLLVSRDDGATWADTSTEVQDAWVTEAGEVFAIANDPPRLVHHPLDADPAVASIPVDTSFGVRGIGDTLFVLGSRVDASTNEPRFVVLRTTDAGARWDELAVLPGHGSMLTLDATSTPRGLVVSTTIIDGLSCFGMVAARRYRVEDGEVTTSMLVDDEACAYHNEACANLDLLASGAHGVMYGLAARDLARTSSTLAILAPTERITRTTLSTEGRALIGHNGRITLAVIDGLLVRLDGTRHRVLDHHVPENADMLHVDDRGRAWVVTPAGVFRFSRGTGFARVLAFDPAQ